jgi:hypothetical protein
MDKVDSPLEMRTKRTKSKDPNRQLMELKGEVGDIPHLI